MTAVEFQAWPKTPRLFRDITVTEKIDGTNAAVIVVPGHPTESDSNCTIVEVEEGRWLKVGAQSRKRLVTPDADNFGFARWVFDNAEALARILGEGTHYGEWWGSGIQRGYGLAKGEKRFSLFNVHRYGRLVVDAEGVHQLAGLDVVPRLYQGPFDMEAIQDHGLDYLRRHGSEAAPGFDRPEGIIVYHSASGQVYKVLLESDDLPKSLAGVA